LRGLSIIIPSKNSANLVPCIERLRAMESVANIIVVDDGLDLSPADARSEGHCWLCDMDPTQRISGVKPFIFARNVNLGIVAAGHRIDITTHSDLVARFIQGRGGDDVVILGDDGLLETPGGFTLLQRAAAEHPEFGLIASTCNNVGNTNQWPKGIGLREDPRMVCFVAVLIPRRTIDLVGLLDEEFSGYGFEDDSYCLRVRRAGLKIGIHDGCFVDHAILKSTFRSGDCRELFDRNAEIFRRKWGADNLAI
jgi:GT2 family glycosyltransferase